MSAINWRNLKLTLLREGVAPKYARRTVDELQQHLKDLESEALAAGASQEEARLQAYRAIGNEESIVREVLARPELKSWLYRYPALMIAAVFVFPLLFILLTYSLVLLPIQTLGSTDGGAEPSAILQGFISLVLVFNTYVLTPLCMLGLCVFAQRYAVKIAWTLPALLLIAFIGSGLNYNIVWSAEPHQSSFSIMWGYSFLGMPVRENLTTFSVLRMLASVAACLVLLHFYRPLETTKQPTPAN